MTDAARQNATTSVRSRRPRVPRVSHVPGVGRVRPTSMTPTLVALGDLLLDVVVRAGRPVERGSDVPGHIRFRQGGSAANVARSFVRSGGRGVLICGVGRDGWAERLLAAMRADGVEVHAVASRGSTGRLAAIIDAFGERSFVTQRGAADTLRPGDLRESWFRGVRVLHIPAYSLFHEPLSESAARAAVLAHEVGALVSVDLASAAPLRAFGPDAARAAIGALGTDVLFANRDEAAVLTGGRDRSPMPLLELASLVVLKEGADGCRILWRDMATGAGHRSDIATTPIAAVDTTGAGDAFAAGFLAALMGPAGMMRMPLPVGRWDAATLRHAALAGHRSASVLLRRPRADLGL